MIHPRNAARALALAWSVVLLASSLAPACGPVRNGLAYVTPTVPGAAECTDGAQRCNAGVPESCRAHDGVARWWPLTPLAPDGRPARCGVCIVSDAGRAGCDAVDAGTGDAS